MASAADMLEVKVEFDKIKIQAEQFQKWFAKLDKKVGNYDAMSENFATVNSS